MHSRLAAFAVAGKKIKFETVKITMKQILILLFLLPAFGFSQAKPSAAAGYEITGTIKGYEDGASVAFLNQKTGALEKQGAFDKNTFIIKGSLPEPALVLIVLNEQAPAIPVFLDNSKITITGDKEHLDGLVIRGSESQDQFMELSNTLKPYENSFAADADKEETSLAAVDKLAAGFVKKYPSSYVSPVAIIRIMQASGNVSLADELYNSLAPAVKKSMLAQYLNQQLAIARINPIGSQIADFSQNDTAGHAVHISSFRGKYVLIDFWASWCRPCRMENPNVVAAYNKYHDKNFTVLGVSLDQAKPAWLSAIHMDGLNWTHVSDLKGWSNQVAALFQVTSIPQNLLIDPAGKIIAKNLRGEALQKKLNALLN